MQRAWTKFVLNFVRGLFCFWVEYSILFAIVMCVAEMLNAIVTQKMNVNKLAHAINLKRK